MKITLYLTSLITMTHAMVKNKIVLRQLYGEWLIMHSNHPCFSGMNNKFVTLYPKRQIVLRSYHSLGPFLIEHEKSGSFAIECSSPDESCPIVDDDVLCTIDIQWQKKVKTFQTFFGISVKELPSATLQDTMNTTTTLNLNYFEKNQLYLSDTDTHINLSRNNRPDEPERGTSLSVFVASQMFGSILLHVLHNTFRDIF